MPWARSSPRWWASAGAAWLGGTSRENGAGHPVGVDQVAQHSGGLLLDLAYSFPGDPEFPADDVEGQAGAAVDHTVG
jgi:hypothetical protein